MKQNQTQNQVKTSLQPYPQHPISQLYQSSLFYNQRRINQAFQQIRQVKFMNDLQSSQKAQQMKIKYNLRDDNIQWIKKKLQQFEQIQKVHQERFFFNDKGLQQLDKGLKLFFKDIQQYDIHKIKIHKQELNRNNYILYRSGNQDEDSQQVFQQTIKKLIHKIKRPQFINKDAQKKFDQLQNLLPQKKYYFKKLFVALHSSIEAYRHLDTGILGAGKKGVKSNIGQCISYLQTGLDVAAKFPIVNLYAEMVSGLAGLYLEQEHNFVKTQIINAFRDYETPNKLTNAIIEMILYLCSHKKFIEIILKPPNYYDFPWYMIIKAQAQNKLYYLTHYRNQLLSKFTGFKNNMTMKQENMAMQHCVQILVTILKKKSFHEERNLTQIATTWMQSKINHNSQKVIENQSTMQQESQSFIEENPCQCRTF